MPSAAFPEAGIRTVEAAGDGDYCAAYAVDHEWIVLAAKTEEAVRSMERAAALLPELGTTVSLEIPIPIAFRKGTQSAPALARYRRVPGVELVADSLQRLARRDQERGAADLALFLRQVHSFPVERARRAGVPVCSYPFCTTERGVAEGTAEEEYRRDLDRLFHRRELDRRTRDYRRRIVEEHLSSLRESKGALCQLHTELSEDHVLWNPSTARITGVIDFSGMVLGDSVRDLLYLYEEYGPPFVDLLLDRYSLGDRPDVLARLRFLYRWHTALRLLWAPEHRYEPGIALRSEELRRLELRDAGV